MIRKMFRKFMCKHEWKRYRLVKTEHFQNHPDITTYEYYCPKCESFKKIRS